MTDKPFKILTKARTVDITFPTLIETNLKVYHGKSWWIIKDQKTGEVVGVFVKLNKEEKNVNG